MTNLNFEPYFENTNIQYYDSKYIVTILENILGDTLEETKNKINKTQVIVSKEQIIEYLEKTFEEEDPKLKKRIENPNPKTSGNIFKRMDENTLEKRYLDSLNVQRYSFEPYALEYFKRYTTIVRNKIFLLLNIIEKIGNKDSLSIQNLLEELDIQLDENGNILKEDIIRLITPTIYNIRLLNEKVTEANDLSTYLTFKMSKHSLHRDDWSEGDIYPTESLQIKNLNFDCLKGNVPLSNNQRSELEEQQNRSLKKNAKMIIDLF